MDRVLQLEEVKKLKRVAKQAMIAESRRHEAEPILSQVPELGLVRVAQIIATVDTPFRFRTKRLFWKYLGLPVEMSSSSDHEVVYGRARHSSGDLLQFGGDEYSLSLGQKPQCH